MKLYWAKIVLGALAIFGIGMIIKKAIDSAKDHVQIITDSSEPITIPFPLGIMPFRLDGQTLSKVQRVTLLRDTPKGISNIRVMVKLADSLTPEVMKHCMLVIDDLERMNENTTFRCQPADTAGLALVHYGEVEIEGLAESFPLLLPESTVAEMRSESGVDQMEENADSVADAMEAYADSMSDLADSITDFNMQMADSIREEAMQRSDSIREAALRMADSIRRARQAAPPAAPRNRRPR